MLEMGTEALQQSLVAIEALTLEAPSIGLLSLKDPSLRVSLYV